MLHVGVGINAVTKVCYVALSAKLQQHFFGQFWYVFLSTYIRIKTELQNILEMWANAQRDGRHGEYRWRPLFNAAKFGWRPLLDAV